MQRTRTTGSHTLAKTSTTSITSLKSKRKLTTRTTQPTRHKPTTITTTTTTPLAQFSTTTTTTPEDPTTTAPKRKKSKRSSSTQSTETLTQSTDVKNHTAISNSPHGVLVRDFMRESLYSKRGYFNASRVINSPGVINFSQLLGKAAYEKRLDELYFSGIQGWTTPVEIFQPFYAQSLARYFVSHLIQSVNGNSVVNGDKLGNFIKFKKGNKSLIPPTTVHSTDGLDLSQDNYAREFGVALKKPDMAAVGENTNVSIIEIGGGNGTCAANIMDFLRSYYPNVYKSTNYTIFEMSETLSWQQRELLDASHSGKYRVYTKNAAEIDYSTLPHNLKQQYLNRKGNDNAATTSTPEPNPVITEPTIITNTDGTTTALPAQRRPPPQQNPLQKPVVATAPKAVFGAVKEEAIKHEIPKDHAFIFGLEVLDNMVHDKVIKGKDGNWYQVMVAEKSAMDAVGKAAMEDPSKMYKFPIYDHPKTALKTALDQLQSERGTDAESLTAPAHQQGVGDLEGGKVGVKKSKRNYHQIDAQTLKNYMTEQPFPVQYHLLNTLPESKYFEYVMPIYDPVIEECAQLFTTYHASPHFNPESTTISHVQNKGLPQHQQGGIMSWLTSRILKKNLSFVDEVVYLPTELLRFIHRVNILYPSHTLLLADFDALPTTEEIPAVNAPVVAHKATESQLRGKTKDEPSYLVELGLCDIFFPTDFNFIKHMYTEICLDGKIAKKQHISPLSTVNGGKKEAGEQNGQNSTKVMDNEPIEKSTVDKVLSQPTQIQDTTIALTQELFLESFAETRKTECKNGFNPMLADYNNMALFIGQRK